MAATAALDHLETNVTEQPNQFWVLQDHPRNKIKILEEMSDLHLLEILLLENCLIQKPNQSFHPNNPKANLSQIWQLQDSELPLGLPLLQLSLHNKLLPNSINSTNRDNKQCNNPEGLKLLSNNLDALALNKDQDKLSLVNNHL